MFGSTIEMMDIQAMKTCIALSWISWIYVDRPKEWFVKCVRLCAQVHASPQVILCT